MNDTLVKKIETPANVPMKGLVSCREIPRCAKKEILRGTNDPSRKFGFKKDGLSRAFWVETRMTTVNVSVSQNVVIIDRITTGQNTQRSQTD